MQPTTTRLSTRQAAEYLGIPEATLRWWRHRGDRGPRSYALCAARCLRRGRPRHLGRPAQSRNATLWRLTKPYDPGHDSYKRAHRSGVEDRWHRRGTGTPCTNPKHGKLGTLVESAKHGDGKRWRARFVDPSGREAERSFHVKAEATAWVTAQTADIAKGSYVAPKDAVMTFDAWAEKWLASYSKSAAVLGTPGQDPSEDDPGDVRSDDAGRDQAVHGDRMDRHPQGRLQAVHRLRPVSATDACAGRRCPRWSAGSNPCSRRTAPPTGHVEQFCPTTEQVWQLHDAMPEHLQVAVLLGGFAGLRVSEAVALRVEDVDFTRGVVFPKVQWSQDKGWLVPLKTKGSSAPVPIPRELTLMLSASVQQFPARRWSPTAGEACRPVDR